MELYKEGNIHIGTIQVFFGKDPIVEIEGEKYTVYGHNKRMIRGSDLISQFTYEYWEEYQKVFAESSEGNSSADNTFGN